MDNIQQFIAFVFVALLWAVNLAGTTSSTSNEPGSVLFQQKNNLVCSGDFKDPHTNIIISGSLDESNFNGIIRFIGETNTELDTRPARGTLTFDGENNILIVKYNFVVDGKVLLPNPYRRILVAGDTLAELRGNNFSGPVPLSLDWFGKIPGQYETQLSCLRF